MIRIFTIPFDSQTEIFPDEAFTSFLAGKSVISMTPQFFQNGHRAYWTVLIEYEATDSGDRKAHASSQPEMATEDRALFERLKTWRREKADRDGSPVFIIAKNSQLADIACKKPKSLEGLKQIKGFGTKKVQLHGAEILEIVKSSPEENQAPAKPDESSDE